MKNLLPEISIETIRSWAELESDSFTEHVWQKIAKKAFQAGANHELHRVVIWLKEKVPNGIDLSESLFAERRPKPLSKRQQAMQQLKDLIQNGTSESEVDKILEVLENLSEE